MKTHLLLLIAGEGSRLRPLTNDRPKCMVPVAGKPIIERQLDIFEEFPLASITGVTGYKSEMLLKYPLIRQVKNENFATTNISKSFSIGLESVLQKASAEDSIIISYGDIIFHRDVFKKIYEFKTEFATVVDKKYLGLWEARMPDPLSDLESLKLTPDNRIIEISNKPKSYGEIDAQYIGLTKISCRVAHRILNLLNENTDNVAGLSMTHFMNYLIQNKNETIYGCPIHAGWVEIDSTLDLKALEPLLDKFLVPQL